MIEFILDLDPTAKARPRFSRRGHTYTPASTRQFESAVRMASARYKPATPILGGLRVNLDFYMRPPQRKVRDVPSVKPDLDNLIKAVTDALNGVMWADDAQIVECTARKLYDWHTRKGRIYISIDRLEL